MFFPINDLINPLFTGKMAPFVDTEGMEYSLPRGVESPQAIEELKNVLGGNFEKMIPIAPERITLGKRLLRLVVGQMIVEDFIRSSQSVTLKHEGRGIRLEFENQGADLALILHGSGAVKRIDIPRISNNGEFFMQNLFDGRAGPDSDYRDIWKIQSAAAVRAIALQTIKERGVTEE